MATQFGTLGPTKSDPNVKKQDLPFDTIPLVNMMDFATFPPSMRAFDNVYYTPQCNVQLCKTSPY